MNVEQTKQALIALLDKEGLSPIHFDEKCNLHRALACAQTGGEVAQAVYEQMELLLKAYGIELQEIVMHSLTPNVWADHDVLINPEQVLLKGDSDLFVFADGSVKTVQDVNRDVLYFGEVDLLVKDGYAKVYGTNHQVIAENSGSVEALGSTSVLAKDSADVYLNDNARAVLVGDGVSAILYDRSFAECVKGDRVWAHNQSQLFVHPNAGLTRLSVSGTSRAFLSRRDDDASWIEIHISHAALLYVPDKRALKIEKDKSALLFDRSTLGISESEVLDLIVPRYQKGTITFSPLIRKPIAIGQLKQDLRPLLPDWDEFYTLYFEKAKDEREVCDLLTPYLPDMVDKGLTGNFLREHFTERTLNEHGIYFDYKYGCHYPEIEDEQTMYVFGDGLTAERSLPVYCYEHTLHVQNEFSGYDPTAGQEACLILFGGEEAYVQGGAKCFGLDKVLVHAKDNAKLWLKGKSSAETEGCVHVVAQENASVKAKGHSRLRLADDATAEVDEHTRALLTGNNKVDVKGQAEVGFFTNSAVSKPEIIVRSNEATLVGLRSLKDYQRFLARVQEDSTEKLDTSKRRKQ